MPTQYRQHTPASVHHGRWLELYRRPELGGSDPARFTTFDRQQEDSGRVGST